MSVLVFVRGAIPEPVPATRYALLGETTDARRSDAFSARDVLAAQADAIDEAAMGWTKAFAQRARVNGVSFKEALAWKGVSLWYFAELYLHHSTEAPRHVRSLETFARVIEAEAPERIASIGLSGEEDALLSRLAEATGRAFDGPAGRPSRPSAGPVSRRSRWNGAKLVLSAVKAALTGGTPRPAHDARAAVLFLSHTAFWRSRRDEEDENAYEQYFDGLIPAVNADPLLRSVVVAVGPRSAHRRRGIAERLREWFGVHAKTDEFTPINRYTTPRVARETLRATREIRRAWKALAKDPSLAEAFSHRGVRFDDLAAADLAATLLLQLPWAVRSYEEIAETLSAIRPAAMALYAESSGFGRAALAAARAASVKTVAIQHGIVYPKYYSYRHEADEADCPLPDRTAVFGHEARRLLLEMGRYPESSLVVTGSPKFDALLERSRSRRARDLRRSLGVHEGEALLVVASRFRPIRETHQAIGSAFPLFVRAVEAMENVTALVKPHPAELAEPYAAVLDAAKARRVRLVSPQHDLADLLVASDALVTVESLSAVEALVLSRPVVVLNMPTNLRAIVEAGAALGVQTGADPRHPLERLLFDPPTRSALQDARRAYLAEVAHGVDGGAMNRMLDLIRQTALSPSVVPS